MKVKIGVKKDGKIIDVTIFGGFNVYSLTLYTIYE